MVHLSEIAIGVEALMLLVGLKEASFARLGVEIVARYLLSNPMSSVL